MISFSIWTFDRNYLKFSLKQGACTFQKNLLHNLTPNINQQKQPLADVLQNVLLKFCEFHRKTSPLESLFNKVAVMWPATLLKGGSNTGVFL